MGDAGGVVILPPLITGRRGPSSGVVLPRASRDFVFGCSSDGSNYYADGAATTRGPLGSATMTVCALFYWTGSNPAANAMLAHRINGTAGFSLYLSTAGVVTGSIYDGTPTLQTTNTQAPTASSVSIAYLRYGSGNLDLRVNATDVTQKTGLTGYTSPGSSQLGLGAAVAGATPYGVGSLLGVCFAESTRLSDAQLSTHTAACKAAAAMVPFPAGTSYLWRGEEAAANLSSWEARVAPSFAVTITDVTNDTITIAAASGFTPAVGDVLQQGTVSSAITARTSDLIFDVASGTGFTAAAATAYEHRVCARTGAVTRGAHHRSLFV